MPIRHITKHCSHVTAGRSVINALQARLKYRAATGWETCTAACLLCSRGRGVPEGQGVPGMLLAPAVHFQQCILEYSL